MRAGRLHFISVFHFFFCKEPYHTFDITAFALPFDFVIQKRFLQTSEMESSVCFCASDFKAGLSGDYIDMIQVQCCNMQHVIIIVPSDFLVLTKFRINLAEDAAILFAVILFRV